MNRDACVGADTESISAGELAKMGLCEKQIRLRQLLGPRKVCSRRAAAQREGVVEHAAMHSAAKNESKSPCFIATSIYGIDAAETDFLRDFRDAKLLPKWWGRPLVILYYRVSPLIVTIIERHPTVHRHVKHKLDQLIRNLQRRCYVE